VRVGVDVGGTFTDFVFVHDDGRISYHKTPSTPDDPSRAILEGLSVVAGADIEALVHGSTVATNAVLERKGARTALIATAGFGDMLAIGRQVRPSLYDIDVPLPRPLVAATVEVEERLDPEGREVTGLGDLEALRRAVEALGVESIAVVLLFSYVDAIHEEAVARALAPLRVPISVSSQVVREYREYERASTTVVNAYVAPVMERYIARLEASLPTRGFRIMQSNGGSMPPGEARRRPVHTILSGPAGGVAGASRVGEAAACPRFVTFDMGGTSTDVALHDGRVAVTSEGAVEGCPLRVPMVDIHTVGAGGGSIAAFDAGGALSVGPESAGAVPGPACYGRGGERCTVTDANLALGRLSPKHFLGGKMALDAAASHRVVEALAGAVDAREVAAAVVRVVNSNMERALRVISVERGYDVRDFVLLCFGGAGGLHAVELAAALEMKGVLVPASPGTLSAYGVLNADVIKDLSQTVLGRSEGLEGVLDGLEAEGRGVLAAEGVGGELRVTRSVDVRYVGQSYEISVPFEAPGDFAGEFHDRHERLFGHADRAAAVEIVNARVRLVAPTPPLPLTRIGAAEGAVPLAGRQAAWCGDGWREAAVIDREGLRAGHCFEGPAIVVEFTSTTWVPPGASCRVDEHANLWIDL
jgi:N-methylhydantoinase A